MKKAKNLFLLGEGYLRIGQKDEALKIFKKIKKIFSGGHGVVPWLVPKKDRQRLSDGFYRLGLAFLSEHAGTGQALLAFKERGGKLPTALFVIRGDRYIKDKNIKQAIECYKAANAKKKLETCAMFLLKNNWPMEDISSAFKAAGVKPPKEKIISEGYKRLKEGKSIDDALEGFRMVGELPRRENLVDFANKAMAHENFDEAMRGYKLAGTKAPDGMLLICAEGAFKRDNFFMVDKCLREMKDKEAISSFGDRYLSGDRLEYAFTAFSIAKDKGKLLAVAEKCMSTGGHFKLLLKCYKEAREKIPAEKFSEKGRSILKTWPNDALDYLRVAKDKKGLMDCADEFLSRYDKKKALQAYALAEGLS